MPPLGPPKLHRNGEGEDRSPGAREESVGGGEWQEDSEGLDVAVRSTAWFDPGRLDLLHGHEGGPG